MRRLPLPSFRHAALVLAALGLTLAVLPGAALAQPDPAPPEQSKSEQSKSGQPKSGQPKSEQSAPASAPAERCPGDSLCTWPSPDFAGSITEIPDATASCHALPRSATSAMNDTGFPAEFFAGADCKGELITEVPVGGQAPSFVKAASVRLKSAPAAQKKPAAPAGNKSEAPAENRTDADPKATP